MVASSPCLLIMSVSVMPERRLVNRFRVLALLNSCFGKSGGTTSLLSILLSIDPDIVRHSEGPTTADHAVRQRFTAFLPDFLLPCGRLISVRSVVQLYPGPSQQKCAGRIEKSLNKEDDDSPPRKPRNELHGYGVFL